MAPGAVFTVVTTYGEFTEWQIAKIKAQKAAIWAWGEIFYTDAFGYKRHSWFRLIYIGSGTIEPEGGMNTDEEGNGSD